MVFLWFLYCVYTGYDGEQLSGLKNEQCSMSNFLGNHVSRTAELDSNSRYGRVPTV